MSSMGRPLTPPDLLMRSTAICTPTSAVFPPAAAKPDSGCSVPILYGLAWPNAGRHGAGTSIMAPGAPAALALHPMRRRRVSLPLYQNVASRSSRLLLSVIAVPLWFAQTRLRFPPRAQRRKPRSYPRPGRSIPLASACRAFSLSFLDQTIGRHHIRPVPHGNSRNSRRRGRGRPPEGEARADDDAGRARQHGRRERLAQNEVTLRHSEHRREQQDLARRRRAHAGERLGPAPEGERRRYEDVVDRVDDQLWGEPDRVIPFENDRRNR